MQQQKYSHENARTVYFDLFRCIERPNGRLNVLKYSDTNLLTQIRHPYSFKYHTTDTETSRVVKNNDVQPDTKPIGLSGYVETDNDGG